MNLPRSASFALPLAAAVLSLLGLASCNAQKPATGTQQKIAQLKDLRDAGVLTQAEYDVKVAALRAPAPASHPKTPAKLGEPTVSHTLNDQAWGMPWGTIKLPAGWGFNGGVVHGDNCIVSGDNPMWAAESPDKMVGIMVLPVLKAGWLSDPQEMAQMRQAGCPILQSTRAADYLIQVVLPHLHQNFKVIGTAPEPMLEPMANQFRQMNAQAPPMQSQFSQSRNTVDTARVVLSYEEGGVTRVEMASAELSCYETMLGGMGMGPGFHSIDCTSYETVIVHAPDDGTPVTSLATMDLSKSTDKPFFSIQPNPAWQKRFEEVSQQTSRQIQAQSQANMAATQANIKSNQDAAAQRSASIASVSDYSRKVHNQVYQNQQRANDQVNGAYAAHMGDYNVYTNTSTGQQYQMSNQYNNTYVNQQGNVGLQTNSASSPGVDWTQLTPKY